MTRAGRELSSEAAAPRRRAPGALAAFAVATACLAVAACAPPGSGTRGFGSRRILDVRDTTLELGSFSRDGSRVYLARTRYLTHPGGIVERRFDLDLLDLATGALRPLVGDGVWAAVIPNGTGDGHSLAIQHYSGAEHPTLSFIDEVVDERDDPSARLDISDTVFLTMRVGRTRADPIVVDRIGPDGERRSWVGPPTALVPAPAGVTSLDVAGVNARGSFIRMRMPEAGPGADVLAHVPFDGAAPTEIVPASPADVLVIPGEAGRPAVDQAVLDPKFRPLHLCAAPTGEAADGGERCYLLYRRLLTDGTSRMFVHYVDGDPRELALPGALDSDTSEILMEPGARALAWIVPGTINTYDAIFTWQVGSEEIGTCPAYGDQLYDVTWFGGASGAERFAAIAYRNAYTTAGGTVFPYTASRGLAFGVTGRGPCSARDIGNANVYAVRASPDERRLTWVQMSQQSESESRSEIHLADVDGAQDRIVASGPSLASTQFLDDRQLLFMRDGGDGFGLSWLDFTQEPVVEHPIAERISGESAWLGPRWLLLVNEYSQQDSNGTLAAVHLETGEERLVSRSVASLSARWARPQPDAADLPVVYVVRGRVASGQDGVWVARMPYAEFVAPP